MAGRFNFFVGRQNTPKGESSSAASLEAGLKASLKELMQNFNEFCDGLPGLTQDVLVEALEPTFGKAIERCPKKTGDLVNSGYLESEKFRDGARVEMGFGRYNRPAYAVFVHEMPYHHEAPTQSKFLESAIDEDYFTIVSSIPRLIREYAGT